MRKIFSVICPKEEDKRYFQKQNTNTQTILMCM